MLERLLDNLTTSQLQDLRHRLNQTDESSTVLVPVGPKAFRLATLRFDKLCWSSTQNDATAYISKAQALEMLQAVVSKRLPMKETIDQTDSGVPVEDAGEEAGTFTSPSPPEKSSLSSSMPLIDIREEVDEDGKPIHTEAIDMTNHLQHLVPADKEQSPGYDDVLSESDPRPMENHEFKKLTARLDELDLLEEAGAEVPNVALVNRPTKQTALSSPRRKAAAKGWSKGFLNKQKSKPAEPLSSLDTKRQCATKSVSFGTDQVHEIPREGNQRPLKDQSLRESRPIEPALFTGIVHERPRRKQSTEEQAKGQRLSRFAQERKQGLR